MLCNRLLRRARELTADLTRPSPRSTNFAQLPVVTAHPAPTFERLRRVVLTDDVSRTLFDEYAAHRATERGKEEVGWVLLGRRDRDEATVLATLPAGMDRDAGEAHVRFNGIAQSIGYRMVWQSDRNIRILGVVHTHPGSLRHPSKGDFRGDKDWVPQLRGGEGVFGIGTADAEPDATSVATGSHPQPHMQCLGDLRFSWYTLATGDRRYAEVPVELTIGPDLAKPWRPVWAEVEEHAARLDRLARQMAKVRFDVAPGKRGAALQVIVGLAEPGQALRLTIEGKDVRYFIEQDGDIRQADLPDSRPDEGVYLLLAELAARS